MQQLDEGGDNEVLFMCFYIIIIINYYEYLQLPRCVSVFYVKSI